MADGGALRELLALFQLQVSDEELEHAGKHVEGFVEKLKATGKVMAEAFAVKVIKDFISEQVEAAAHVQDLADRLDVSASNLQDFGNVAKSAGLDLDAAAHMLGRVSAQLGEARMGSKEAATEFARLHVSVKDAHGAARPLFDVIEDVSEGLSRLPDQQKRAAVVMKLFGREGKALLPVLAQDKEKLHEMLVEAHELSGGIGDDYYENAKKAREESEKFGIVTQSIKNRITLMLLPAFIRLAIGAKKLALGFVDFTKKTTFLKTALIALSALMAYKFAGSVMTLLKVFGLLGPTVGATIAKLWAFAQPLVVIGLLYLIFDDLFALMKGGKSVIGDLLDSFLGLGAGAELGIMLNAVLQDTISFAEDLAGIIGGSLILAITAAADAVIALGKGMNDLVHGRWDQVGKDFSKGFGDLPAITKRIGAMATHMTSSGQVKKALDLQIQGVDPRDLLAAMNAPGGEGILNGTAPAPDARVTGGGRQPVSMTRGTGTAAHAVALPAPAAGTAAAPALNQTNTYNTTVHTSSDQPNAVGHAVGQGVATAQEKANNNAIRNLTRK